MILVTDLTPKMYAAIANGCGATQGWQAWIRPPQGHARARCDTHDLAYRLGGTWSERKDADLSLLKGLMRDMREVRWWQRPGFYLKAQLYYLVVRALGHANWHYYEDGPRDWAWLRKNYDPAAPEKQQSAAIMEDMLYRMRMGLE